MRSSIRWEQLKKMLPFVARWQDVDVTEDQRRSLEAIDQYYLQDEKRSEKKNLRRYFLDLRETLTIEEITENSRKLSQYFFATDLYRNSRFLFLYLSFGKEFDTDFLIRQAFSDGKRVCVPVIIEKQMKLCEINQNTVYKIGHFGIREPESAEIDEKLSPDLAVVPALALNPLGFRIGYGGGYYDRFLADYHGISVGFLFSQFLTCDFIPDPYDVPIDFMVGFSSFGNAELISLK